MNLKRRMLNMSERGGFALPKIRELKRMPSEHKKAAVIDFEKLQNIKRELKEINEDIEKLGHVVDKTALPMEIQGKINQLLDVRKARWVGYGTAVGLVGLACVSLPAYIKSPKDAAGIAFFPTMFNTWMAMGDVLSMTWSVGRAVRESKDSSIEKLRTNYRYFFIDRKGNLVGTNSRTLLGIFGRMREELK